MSVFYSEKKNKFYYCFHSISKFWDYFIERISEILSALKNIKWFIIRKFNQNGSWEPCAPFKVELAACILQLLTSITNKPLLYFQYSSVTNFKSFKNHH